MMMSADFKYCLARATSPMAFVKFPLTFLAMRRRRVELAATS